MITQESIDRTHSVNKLNKNLRNIKESILFPLISIGIRINQIVTSNNSFYTNEKTLLHYKDLFQGYKSI